MLCLGFSVVLTPNPSGEGYMRRRDFIKVTAVSVAAWPLAVRAQQAAMPVIGFVRITTPEDSAHLVAAFRQGLGESGFVEGRNVTIEYRYALNQVDRLPALMAELVGRGVAVLAATGGTISARAAKAATTTVPIVFTTGDDPVRVGLVASLNRPGGNATGVSVFTARLGSKRLGLLHEMVPSASPIAILVNPTNPDTEDEANDIQEAAQGLGVQVFVVRASKADDLDGAFTTLVQHQARAVIVGSDTFFTSQRSQISLLAARQSLPTMWVTRIEAEAGGLMCYGANIPNVYRQAGVYAGQILKGAKPANLPVQLPIKFDLVINLQTAKAIGLTVPDSLLARADEVIE
jgi:putative tryptophan/tyrosine transport system substrate-binding protein